jgi:hypothetical protein
MSSVYVSRSVVGDGVAQTGSIPTGQVLWQATRLVLDSTSRLGLEGTARVIVEDAGGIANPVILGTPKRPTVSFTVPTDYCLFLTCGRLVLDNAMRVTLQGTADLILSDLFGTRSRIVLAGNG